MFRLGAQYLVITGLLVVGLLAAPTGSAAHAGADHPAEAMAGVPGGNVLGVIVIALATGFVTWRLMPWRPGRAGTGPSVDAERR